MKFAAENLIVVEGEAPEVLEDLEAPTHAFIGGSSGNMKAIMELLLRQNPRVRIVINCIAMESVAEALRCLKGAAGHGYGCGAAQCGKGKKSRALPYDDGQNPITIISCTGGIR